MGDAGNLEQPMAIVLFQRFAIDTRIGHFIGVDRSQQVAQSIANRQTLIGSCRHGRESIVEQCPPSCRRFGREFAPCGGRRQRKRGGHFPQGGKTIQTLQPIENPIPFGRQLSVQLGVGVKYGTLEPVIGLRLKNHFIVGLEWIQCFHRQDLVRRELSPPMSAL